MKSISLILLILMLATSCEDAVLIGYNGYKFNEGDLPDNPVNLEDFNTEYNDYNSSAPTLGELIPFCFSTNRKNKFLNPERDFDVIYEPMSVVFDKTSGMLTVENNYGPWTRSGYGSKFEIIRQGLDQINTLGNELGPNLINSISGDEPYFTLLYATNETGDFEINFTSNKAGYVFSDALPVTFLNSPFDDLYPAFNADNSRIYFCSNRENGNFDIYYTSSHELRTDIEMDIELILSDSSSHEIIKDTALSGEYEDKCPFIFASFLVFTSDRPGGYGGFDLYFSKWEDGKWGEPQNFGPEINSAYDEYRPILIYDGVSNTETMMIFSSNRPGGKGGFDLYFVGVDLGNYWIY